MLGRARNERLECALRARKGLLTRVDINPRAAGVQSGDAERLSTVPNETYDVVLLLEVLEHVREPWSALSEAIRIAKVNGCVVISVPGPIYPFHPFEMDHSRFDGQCLRELLTPYGSILECESEGAPGVEVRTLLLWKKRRFASRRSLKHRMKQHLVEDTNASGLSFYLGTRDAMKVMIRRAMDVAVGFWDRIHPLRRVIEVASAATALWLAYDQLRLGVLSTDVGVVTEMLASGSSRLTGYEMIPPLQGKARAWYARHDEIARNLGQLFLRTASGAPIIGTHLGRLRVERNEGDASGTAAFGELKLISVTLDGAYMRNVNLFRLSLRDVSLDGGSLQGVNFERAEFTNVHGRQIDLSRSMFQGAEIKSTTLPQCTFEDATLVRVLFTGSSLVGCNFDGAHIRLGLFDRELSGSSFVGAEVSETDFRGADLSEADFRNARLRHVDFRGATLTGAMFGGAMLDSVQVSGAAMAGSTLTRMDARDGVVNGCAPTDGRSRRARRKTAGSYEC